MESGSSGRGEPQFPRSEEENIELDQRIAGQERELFGDSPVVSVGENSRNSFFRFIGDKLGIKLLGIGALTAATAIACGGGDERLPTLTIFDPPLEDTPVAIVEDEDTPEPDNSPDAIDTQGPSETQAGGENSGNGGKPAGNETDTPVPSTAMQTSTPESTETSTTEPTIEPTPPDPETQAVLDALPYEIGWSNQYEGFTFAISEGAMNTEFGYTISSIELNGEDALERINEAILYGKFRNYRYETEGPDTRLLTFEEQKEEFEQFKEFLKNNPGLKGEVVGFKDQDVITVDSNNTKNIPLSNLEYDVAKPIIISMVPSKDEKSLYFSEGLSWGYRVINGQLILEIFDGSAGQANQDKGRVVRISEDFASGLSFLSEREAQKRGVIFLTFESDSAKSTRDIYDNFFDVGSGTTVIIANE